MTWVQSNIKAYKKRCTKWVQPNAKVYQMGTAKYKGVPNGYS